MKIELIAEEGYYPTVSNVGDAGADLRAYITDKDKQFLNDSQVFAFVTACAVADYDLYINGTKVDSKATVLDVLDALKNTNFIALAPNERKLVGTSVYIKELSTDREGFVPVIDIRPRSGLAVKHGITVINSPGTVDQNYPNEIKVGLVNTGKDMHIFTDGTRIAQMVVSEVLDLSVLGSTGNTRSGGFGSTGI